MFKKTSIYFSSKKYEVHLFKLLGFTNQEYSTYKIVSIARQKKTKSWFFNNLYFPSMVIISPIFLTIIHNYFNSFAYHKTVTEILIGGSVTLLGINVIRTASTAISEKLIPANVPENFVGRITDLIDEIDIIRNKLERRVWSLSSIGWLLYILQIGQFVNTSHPFIYVILVLVIGLTLISVLHGRFIVLMKTNILDTEDSVTLLFGRLLSQKNDFTDLESKLKEQGL
ncbi:hypothetical protein SAMN05428975_1302 [Mucilaginibacter sp. OK268]|uniref:hypothetical protein n=1 Tax=Mucilaginibacter sp. OK268 TaxID=1881048 RepID=UPI0008830090|nr:hypothetical protein [Mucilaginibacter sp. OK268]SDP45854.1 hypothetical protein SAMN05428975_1302 [Mucilaginibacter sp. OK268]